LKYVLIIGDGMADNPVPSLGGKTPLEYAKKPAIDALARKGEVGSVLNVPKGLPAGSDTAILSIFGCDPRQCYTGRAPLEAAASGIALSPGDAAYRCNMVTFQDGDMPFEEKKILSHSAGSIEGNVSDELVTALFEDPAFKKLADEAGMEVHPASSFRHIAVQHPRTVRRDGPGFRAAAVKQPVDLKGIVLTPPHDHLGEAIGPILPKGCPNAQVLRGLMEAAFRFLDHHPINEGRRAAGKLPANGIWFWAEGTAVKLPSFTENYRRDGGVVSAVPLCHGIAALTGLERIFVEGATGELETNYEGKVDAATEVLRAHDFAAIHVEAPDECTHNGDLAGKLQAIEWLDSRVVAPLLEKLDAADYDYRILILSDHKTLTSTRGHDGDPVPFLLYDSRQDTGAGLPYTEAAGEQGRFIPDGVALMGMLFGQETI